MYEPMKEMPVMDAVSGRRRVYDVIVERASPIPSQRGEDFANVSAYEADACDGSRVRAAALQVQRAGVDAEVLGGHNNIRYACARLLLLLEDNLSAFEPVEPVELPLACIRLCRQDNGRHLVLGKGDRLDGVAASIANRVAIIVTPHFPSLGLGSRHLCRGHHVLVLNLFVVPKNI